jgi:hypothetical protein
VSPIDQLEQDLELPILALPAVQRTIARLVLKTVMAVLRDWERRLAALEEHMRHG